MPNERLSGVPGGQGPRPPDAAAARRLEARVRLLPTREAAAWSEEWGADYSPSWICVMVERFLTFTRGGRPSRSQSSSAESRDFPPGKGCITSILPGALQEGLAVADGVSHLNLLRLLSPTAHWRPHPLCAAELALLNQEVNELGVGGGGGVMMALP